jgi:hypothetical protein
MTPIVQRRQRIALRHPFQFHHGGAQRSIFLLQL